MEDVAGEVFACPVVDIDEPDAPCGGLQFVVFAVSGEIDVCALPDGFFGELCACTSAEGDALHGVGCRFGIAHIGGFKAVFDAVQEIGVGYGFVERADDAETVVCSGLGRHEDAIISDAEYVRHASADAVEDGIHSGMARIDSDTVADSKCDTPFLRGEPADVFQTVEEEGMVADDEVAAHRNGFADDRFRNVCRQQGGGDVRRCVTHLHTRVVPTFLVTQGSRRFYDIDDVL